MNGSKQNIIITTFFSACNIDDGTESSDDEYHSDFIPEKEKTDEEDFEDDNEIEVNKSLRNQSAATLPRMSMKGELS